jgi:uncharacterized OB-fold protein
MLVALCPYCFTTVTYTFLEVEDLAAFCCFFFFFFARCSSCEGKFVVPIRKNCEACANRVECLPLKEGEYLASYVATRNEVIKTR